MVRKPYQVREAIPSSNESIPICVHCGKTAANEALFGIEGVTTIEKYCDSCLEPKEFERFQTIYSRIG